MKHWIALALAFVFVTASNAADKRVPWQQFVSEAHGFTIDMPAAVTATHPDSGSPEWNLSVFDSELHDPWTKFTVMLDTRVAQGIFDPRNVEEILEGSVAKTVKNNEGTLIKSERTPFQGRQAISYEIGYTNDQKDHGVIRGINFMVDGGVMRLIEEHWEKDPDALRQFVHFTGTFKLIPMKYYPADEAYQATSGLRILPPKGWKQGEGQGKLDLVRFTDLNRSLKVSASSNDSYHCANLEAQLREGGMLTESKPVKLGEQQALKLTADVKFPDDGQVLTAVRYCLDVPNNGTVVITGAVNKDEFWRWAAVFDGAAATVKLK